MTKILFWTQPEILFHLSTNSAAGLPATGCQSCNCYTSHCQRCSSAWCCLGHFDPVLSMKLLKWRGYPKESVFLQYLQRGTPHSQLNMSSQIRIFTHQGFGRLSFQDHSGFCVVGLARKRFCLKFHCSFEDLFVSNEWVNVFRSFWASSKFGHKLFAHGNKCIFSICTTTNKTLVTRCLSRFKYMPLRWVLMPQVLQLWPRHQCKCCQVKVVHRLHLSEC